MKSASRTVDEEVRQFDAAMPTICGARRFLSGNVQKVKANWPVTELVSDETGSRRRRGLAQRIERETKIQPMRLTREKTMRLSHLSPTSCVEQEWNLSRRAPSGKDGEILQELLKEEKLWIRKSARRSFQKKEVLEGSGRDVLYRKYYAEEIAHGRCNVPSS